MRTTLNLKDTDISKLNKLASMLALKPDEVVKLLIAQLIETEPLLEKFGGVQAYQQDDPSFKKVHIEFTHIEYELNFDLKKIFKCSLSLLVSCAIALFAESPTIKLKGNDLRFNVMDSYPKYDYIYASSATEYERNLVFQWKKRRE